MAEEIFKDIIGYEGYFMVSNLGRIKIIRYGKEKITIGNMANGYLRFHSTINNVQFTPLIHRLVAEAFIPNPENKPTVNHIDSNRKNNKVENLEWATYSENLIHGYKFGYEHKGEDHHKSKLTQNDVLEIRENKENLSQRKLGKKYGVSQTAIKFIEKRISWKHI